MNTFQIRAFVDYLKKQKEILNEKRTIVSNDINGINRYISDINGNSIESKKSGDKRIRIIK